MESAARTKESLWNPALFASLIVVATVCGGALSCGRQTEKKAEPKQAANAQDPAPQAEPGARPSATRAGTPETLSETCREYAQLVNERCGFDREASEENCLTLHRLGKVAGCEELVQAALRCTEETAQKRSGETGDFCNAKQCDKHDLELEKCLEAHCAKHEEDEDCRWLFKS